MDYLSMGRQQEKQLRRLFFQLFFQTFRSYCITQKKCSGVFIIYKIAHRVRFRKGAPLAHGFGIIARIFHHAHAFAAQQIFFPCPCAERGMERLYEIHGKEIADGYAVCHGEPDYHHILIGNGYTAVTEFNQMHLGVQMEDLYYFLRKIMEKHDWNERLGTYDCILPLNAQERTYLYYLFLYPEKYWKQINFYYNANKAWVPAKSTEKIRKLEAQQEARESFIQTVIQGV